MTPARARLLLVFSLATWGLVFVANHELLEVLPPLHISALRFLGVGTAFASLLFVRPAWRPRLTRRDLGLVAVAGLPVVPGAQLMIVVGQPFVALSLSGLTATSSPAIAAVIAYRFLGERMRCPVSVQQRWWVWSWPSAASPLWSSSRRGRAQI